MVLPRMRTSASVEDAVCRSKPCRSYQDRYNKDERTVMKPYFTVLAITHNM